MKEFFMKVDAVATKISSYMSFGASATVVVVMLTVTADVVGRYFFNTPLTGVMEIIKMAIPVIAFFMFPWATHESRHVRSTVLYMHLPQKVRMVIDVLAPKSNSIPGAAYKISGVPLPKV